MINIKVSFNMCIFNLLISDSLNDEVVDDPKSDINSFVGINSDHVSTYIYLIK